MFCVEQGVDEAADRDGRDHEAAQLVAEHDGRIVGTCRLLLDGGMARLGRMAVSRPVARQGRRRAAAGGGRPRGRRGRRRAHPAARPGRGPRVYDRAGYLPVSDVFVEEGIDHLTMEKRLA